MSSYHRHFPHRQARDPQSQWQEFEGTDASLRIHPPPPRSQYLPSRKSFTLAHDVG